RGNPFRLSLFLCLPFQFRFILIFGKKSTMQFQDILQHVATFHEAFGIKNNRQPTVQISSSEAQLRFDLMKEENEEYLEAVQNGDLTEVADALGDMLYILCGTILKHGMQYKIEDVFQEIQ